MSNESQSYFIQPRPLRSGDTVRFVSPASTPDRDQVEKAVELLKGWGFEVEIGTNAFSKLNYLAGTDDQRLADLNDAFSDENVRAIFATRGGKGSYRIADRVEFEVARRSPKFLVGFSDITILHLALAKQGLGGSIHGALSEEDWTLPGSPRGLSLRELLTTTGDAVLEADDAVETAGLTTTGIVRGLLVGGNLDMVATAAGWALPRMSGKILLLEAVKMHLGQVDRHLCMLKKAGHLDGVAGFALGQFTGFETSGSLTIVDLLYEHLSPFKVPILGGLPVGHGQPAQRIPLCFPTILNCEDRKITVLRGRVPQA